MRKYIIHILILIVILTSFVLVPEVQAVDGRCSVPGAINHLDCDELRGEWIEDSAVKDTAGNNSSGSFCNQLDNEPKFQDLLMFGTCVINSAVIPLIFALAVAMFIWGVVQYVINSSEEAKKEKGKQFMIWGIIALAVMVSVWGLVGILSNTFGIDYVIPQVSPRN